MLVRLRLIIITLWVGSLWSIGFLAVPTLFVTLGGRVLAGTVAAILFDVQAWFSISCALTLLLCIAFDRQARRAHITPFIIVVMLLCSILIQFGLQPKMELMREVAGAGDVMEAPTRTQFMILHTIAGGVYFLQSIMGIWLVFRGRKLS